MDFINYSNVTPFSMYIFEFTHTLTQKDLTDIWQNLPPEIGIKMEESTSSISHELLSHELLGKGAVVKNDVASFVINACSFAVGRRRFDMAGTSCSLKHQFRALETVV